MADEKYTVEVVNRVDDSEVKRGTETVKNMTDSLKAMMAAMNEMTRATKDGGPSALAKWGLTSDQAKTMKETTGAMKSASDAVASFGRATKSIEGIDSIGEAAKRNAAVMMDWRESLKGLQSISEKELGNLNMTAAAMRTTSDAVASLAKAYAAQYEAKKKLYGIDDERKLAAAKLALEQDKAAETKRANMAKEALADKKRESEETLGLLKAETEARKVAAAEGANAAKIAAAEEKTKQVEIQATADLEIQASREVASAQRSASAEALEASRKERQERKIAYAEQVKAQKEAAKAAVERAKSAESAALREIRALESSRFAARELARTYTLAGAAIAAGPIAALKQYANQERAFADVRRTSQEASVFQLDVLTSKYRNLSTEIPIAFEELSRIGTLGAQMDIPTTQLDDFTEAVGTFAAITGETADTTAMAFGRISAMLGGLQESSVGAGDQYMVLASQVAEVGARLVATEAEILNTTVSIASFAHDAGFTQDQVIGLSGALASLRIPPEWARGAIQRIFMRFNRAVADGGDSLDVFARQLGISAQAADNLWRTNPQEFFMRLITSINEMGDSVARTQALTELGFTSTRDANALIRLSGAVSLVEKSFREAEEAGHDTAFATQAMEIVAQTLTETANRLKNALANAFASFGSEGSEVLKLMAEALIRLLNLVASAPPLIKTLVMSGLTLASVIVLIKAAQYGVLALGGSLINARKRMMELGTSGRMTWNNLFESIMRANRALDNFQASQAAAMTKQSRLFTVSSAEPVRILGANFAAAGDAAAKSSIKMGGFFSAAKAGGSGLLNIFGGLPGLLVTVGTVAATAIGTQVYRHITKAKREAQEAAEAIQTLGDAMGSAQDIVSTIIDDSLSVSSAVAADGVQGLSAAMEESSSSIDAASAATSFYVSAQGELVNTTARAAAEQGLFNLELDKAYDKLVMNALASGDYMDKLTQAQLDGLNALGFSVAEFVSQSAKGAEEGEAYLDSMKQKAAAHYREIREELARVKLEAGYIEGMYGTNAPAHMDEATRNHIKQLDEQAAAARATAEAVGVMNDSLMAVDGVAQMAISKSQVLGLEFDEVGDSAEGAEDSIESLSQSLNEFINQAFGMNDATIAIDSALENLGKKLAESGNYLGPDSAAGRESLQAIQGLFQAFADEAQAGVETLGWTTEEAQAHMAMRIQEVVDWLGQQGIDTSYIQQAANEIISAMGFTVSPGIDPTGAYNTMNALKQEAFQTAQYVSQVLAGIGAQMDTMIESAPDRGAAAWGARYQAQGMAKAAGLSNFSGYGGPTWTPAAPTMSSGSASVGSYKPLDFSAAKPSSGGGGGGGGGGGKPSGGGGGGGGRDTGKAVDEFSDFLKRLSSAMKDALNDFWSSSVAMDNYHKSLNSLRDNIQKTTDKIEDLAEANRKLTKDMLEDQQALRDATFFNEIAKKYGDVERIASTQTDMDKASADIADKERQIAANEKEAKTLRAGQFALTGYSDAAINNRAALRDLQTQMVGLIEEYAKTGASTQQVQAYTEKLKREFIAQATQAGFNRTEVIKLAGGFDSLRSTIGTVPRKVSVKTTDNGTTGAVQRAINGLRGKSVPISTYLTPSAGEALATSVAYYLNKGMSRANASWAANLSAQANFFAKHGYLPGYGGRNKGGPIGLAGGGEVPGRPPANPNADNVLARSNNGLYALRSGEWVISQPAVDYYGKGVMDAINTRSMPIVGANSARGAGETVVARLSPNDLVAMARAVSTMLVVDKQVVAKTANAANVGAGNRGKY